MKALILISLFVAATVAVGSIPEEDRWLANLPDPVVDADYHENGSPNPTKVELGRMLFFDKVISGNQNIACATCHHPELGTSDALALPLGEGPTGLGPERKPGLSKDTAVHGRVPRNSPALFNLGAREFIRMFHDGRVENDPEGPYEGGFITPAKWKLPVGLENALAAQAMLPVTSADEMAGQKGENDVADASSLNRAAGPNGVWEEIAQRLQDIPEYVEMFRAAFPEVETDDDISFVHAANAIAAFEAKAFRADDSPFDHYLRGDEIALSGEAQEGMELFYGHANCGSCHGGKFQTDHGFHAIGMPQIGPGKNDGFDGDYWRATGVKGFVEDIGRGRVTVREEDRFKFRTPSLRNVALTGPWGHAGAYSSLEDVVRHHLDPVSSLQRYELAEDDLIPLRGLLELGASGDRLAHEWMSPGRLKGILARDGWVQENPELRQAIVDANELPRQELDEYEIDCLVAFLESLTDPASTDLAHWVPERVPSGLPVAD